MARPRQSLCSGHGSKRNLLCRHGSSFSPCMGAQTRPGGARTQHPAWGHQGQHLKKQGPALGTQLLRAPGRVCFPGATRGELFNTSEPTQDPESLSPHQSPQGSRPASWERPVHTYGPHHHPRPPSPATPLRWHPSPLCSASVLVHVTTRELNVQLESLDARIQISPPSPFSEPVSPLLNGNDDVRKRRLMIPYLPLAHSRCSVSIC